MKPKRKRAKNTVQNPKIYRSLKQATDAATKSYSDAMIGKKKPGFYKHGSPKYQNLHSEGAEASYFGGGE